ncbi:MAG: hypothetical protein IVW53_14665 [Chloroflexi bacterium]|nr:hypothetical protein [Chloroflexota bacterium]
MKTAARNWLQRLTTRTTTADEEQDTRRRRLTAIARTLTAPPPPDIKKQTLITAAQRYARQTNHALSTTLAKLTIDALDAEHLTQKQKADRDV